MILRGQIPPSAFPEFYRRLLFAGAAVTSASNFPTRASFSVAVRARILPEIKGF
jgi:hypothetical protein